MVHLYSAFIQGALQRLCITFTHSHTHSYTDGGGNHARHQPAHRKQPGVQILAQGLFGMWTGGTRIWTANPWSLANLQPLTTMPYWFQRVLNCTWLVAGLYLRPGLFRMASICALLKLEIPMALTKPASTSCSIAWTNRMLQLAEGNAFKHCDSLKGH